MLALRTFIRRWLGITDLTHELAVSQDKIREELLLLRSDLSVTFKDETDPSRQAISKRLGAQVIQKLVAEDRARRHTLGED